MPPRAHNHNGFTSSSSEPFDVTSPPSLPLSRGLMRHDSLPPASLLDRFRPSATNLGVEEDRFPGLAAVNGLPPPPPPPPPPSVAAGSVEPVSMTARRPLTASARNHPGSTTKPHRAIKCYHCRMCEQVTTNCTAPFYSQLYRI